ncbi:hypothetical protein B484DRAFT_359665 [Ochromonadaceae sp. CCMP2298]|nr:hypothetical protein B484DRAFT_359665 [Ochromonadaceae sp. CCMP2298]
MSASSSRDRPKVVFKRVRAPKVPPIRKSLSIILASMQGMEVVVELKTDTEVTGFIDEVDPAMNLTLLNAKHVSADGTTQLSEASNIKGSSIRYVHIPPYVKVSSVVSDHIKKIDRIKNHARPHLIKDKKAVRTLDTSRVIEMNLSTDTQDEEGVEQSQQP